MPNFDLWQEGRNREEAAAAENRAATAHSERQGKTTWVSQSY
jgi:hypothetical protein